MTNRRKKHSIGLVLDAMELRAIELSGTPECFEVCAQGCVTLPQGLVVDGTITDLAAMEVILKQLFRDGDFSRAPLLFGIKNQNILLRLANFPKVPEEKLRQAILLQAQQFIPIPISELVLDCVPGRELIENDRPMVNVLLVGAKKTYLDQIIGLSHALDLPITDIDSALLATHRALLDCQDGAEDCMMLADIDHETLSILIFQKEVILMTRTIAHSAPFLAIACARHDQLVLSSFDYDRLAQLLAEDLAASLRYYASLPDALPVRSIRLLGRFEEMDTLCREIGGRLDIPVALPKLYPSLNGEFDTLHDGTCISLALRGLKG